jgi:hypothetical protein
VVGQVLEYLVASDYAAIEQLTRGRRLTESMLRSAIEDYGRTLVMPPPSCLATLDVVSISGARPAAWSVRVDLWTAEEGRSDLSLECTISARPEGGLSIEVDNLHVL